MVQIWEAKSIEKSLLGRLKRFKPVGGVRYGVSHYQPPFETTSLRSLDANKTGINVAN